MGQLLEYNFVIHFENDTCVTKYRKNIVSLMVTLKVRKIIFHVNISRLINFDMIKKSNLLPIEHLCYDHLYFNTLKLLHQKI